MPDRPGDEAAGATTRRRLFVYNGGFLTRPRIRRILSLAGYDVTLGVPGEGDPVGVWGMSPTAPRGQAVARLRDAPVVSVEDAFLRSLHPGRSGEPTLGLLIDDRGVHFDASRPSRLEETLATHPLDDPGLLSRARDGIAFMARHHLSKFSAVDPSIPVPDAGFVLVIDQTEGDAAVRASGADASSFRDMLACARGEHPDARIVVKQHPETAAGQRRGHLTQADLLRGDALLTEPVSPVHLLSAASAVYTVSSGLGFEAILHGHRPTVFGRPFYAGWGLTDDRTPLERRDRAVSIEQLFAAAMILAPTWYDPVGDRLCEVEDVLHALAAQARAWREDRHGWSASGMSRWKRPHLRRFFGQHGRLTFGGAGRSMAWAGRAEPGDGGVRVEDGFLRSRGLGAELTPPGSLVLDDLGIYYDPSRESRLELLIAESVTLPAADLARAQRLIDRMLSAGLSKYSVGSHPSDLPPGKRILVPGQVEDDRGLLAAAGEIRTNTSLLAYVRAENPDAVIVYKPHPDVEAGLRRGAISARDADIVAESTDPHALLAQVDELWTMTSLLGFEALLRGIPVTVTGAPFYAGWGLTRDVGTIPARRAAHPSVAALAHAALIAYPRYSDPVTGLACSPEQAVTRLAEGPALPPRGILAWLQRLKPRA